MLQCPLLTRSGHCPFVQLAPFATHRHNPLYIRLFGLTEGTRDMTSLVEALSATTTSRRKLLLAGTTLAVVSTYGSGWSVRSAQAQAHSEPKPTPEQMKEMGDFTNATATQLALYAQPLVAMYLLRHSICFGE